MREITFVVCAKCDYACEMSRNGDTVLWTCPNCGEIRSWFWWGGEIDIDAIRTLAREAYGDEFILLERDADSQTD